MKILWFGKLKKQELRLKLLDKFLLYAILIIVKGESDIILIIRKKTDSLF